MEARAGWTVHPDFEAEWEGASASATEVVLNVIRTGETLQALIAGFVKARGLPSTTALIVLEILRGAGEPLQPSVIAERSFLSRPAMSSVLSTLESRGLVTRDAHPGDRRLSLVGITAHGKAVMEGLLPDLHRAEAAYVGPALDEQERRRLLDQLALLQRHLASLSG